MVKELTKGDTEHMPEKPSVVMENFEYVDLPAMRFIGKDVMASGPEAGQKYGEMWGQSAAFMPILDGMAAYATVITDPCALMHHDNKAHTEPMHYIVGKFMKADTPVPEGLDYCDIPACSVAMSIVCGEFNDMIGKIYVMTRDKILADGKKVPYPSGYFHAEIYVKENIPQGGVVSKLGYLFVCCNDGEEKQGRAIG